MSVQFIKSARAGKPVTWYIYAWRGGPLIRKAVQLRKPPLTKADHAAIAAAMVDDRSIDPALFRKMIRDWCPMDPSKPGSPEWNRLAPATKKVWHSYVDAIEARWGSKPLAVWNDPRMVAKVMKWRDELAATPRTADAKITVLRTLLEFIRLRGHISINVAKDIPTLYKGGDRAEIVWTDDDIAAFTAKAAELERPWVTDGLRLAALTGFRREDLVTLTWAQIGEFAIVKTALKTSQGKRRTATIPQTPLLEQLLAELRTRHREEGVETILVNSRGNSWSVSGFGGTFNRVRDAAQIVHLTAEGQRRPKHLHDVRGTFCTMLLAECELTDREAAHIMAWSPERVAEIRRVYVDDKRVVVALGARIAAKQIAKQSGGAARN